MPLFENPRRDATVMVTVYETLPDVLARLRTHANGNVLLEIPDGSSLFLTSAEFRSLREVAQQRRIAVTIVSDDPLRVQLASVFNLAIVGSDQPTGPPTVPPPPDQSSRSPAPVPNRVREGLPPLPDEDTRPRRGERLTPEPTPVRRELTERERSIWPKGRPSSAPSPVPNRSLPPAADDHIDDADDSGRTPTTRRPPVNAPRGRDGNPVRWPDDTSSSRRPTSRSGRIDAVPVDAESSFRPGDDRGTPRIGTERRRGFGTDVPAGMARRPRLSGRVLLAAIGGVIAAILVLTLLLGIFVLSSARVTLALESGRVSGTVDCEIVAPGETGTAAVVVQGEQSDMDVSWTGSVPTTGSRSVPDAAASGRVRFSNPTDQDVVVTAGTELKASGGQTYRVSSDVTVAAGNAALNQFGSGEAVVDATVAGSAGNLGAGEVSGRLDSGVYYSNRDAAMSGGTDRQIRTVQPADLKTLHDTATEQLRQQVVSGQAGNLDPDTQVVPATVTLGSPGYEDDLQAGDDGDAISTTATATATVLTYSNRQLRQQATEALIPVLSDQLTPGVQLSESTVKLTGQPDTGEQSAQGATFQVSGNADTTTSLSDADARALADQLAGKSPSDVNSILSANQRISSYDVTYSPGWLPDRMPNSADRIDIAVRQ